MEQIGWPSALVALGILSVLALFGVTAILRYNVEGALKIFGVLSGLIGVVTGAFVTFFFTRYPLAEARHQAVVAEERTAEMEARLTNLSHQAATFASRVATAPDQASVASLRRDPDFVLMLDAQKWVYSPSLKRIRRSPELPEQGNEPESEPK